MMKCNQLENCTFKRAKNDIYFQVGANKNLLSVPVIHKEMSGICLNFHIYLKAQFIF